MAFDYVHCTRHERAQPRAMRCVCKMCVCARVGNLSPFYSPAIGLTARVYQMPTQRLHPGIKSQSCWIPCPMWSQTRRRESVAATAKPLFGHVCSDPLNPGTIADEDNLEVKLYRFALEFDFVCCSKLWSRIVRLTVEHESEQRKCAVKIG